jgi:DNA-binding transcriptional MerR regulator
MSPELRKPSPAAVGGKPGTGQPATTPELPSRGYFTLNEVCEISDTQPYVLNFWQSEFPRITGKKRGRQTIYTMEDLRLVLQIKSMLHDQALSISEARKQIDSGVGPEPPAVDESQTGIQADAVSDTESAEAEDQLETLQGRLTGLRSRYEGATRQISILKAKLQSMDEMRSKSKEGQAELDSIRRKRDDALEEVELLKSRNVALATESENFRSMVHESDQARDRYMEARSEMAERLEQILRAFRSLTAAARED